MKVDGMTIHKVIEDSTTNLPLQFMCSGISAADLEGLRSWYWSGELDPDPANAQMRIYFHSYIVQADGKNILIDGCVGNHKPRAFEAYANLDSAYLDNFRKTGVAPEDIDFVLCTHLHHDHVGWNTRLENGRWVPTFPNARYLFSAADYRHYGTPGAQGYIDDFTSFQDSVLPIVEHGLAELVDTNRLVQHGLTCDVWLEPAPGHSPGSCTIHCGGSGASKAVFTGDAFHHPVQLTNPDLVFLGDFDARLARQTRIALFDRFADSDTLVFPAHFGGASGGWIRRHGGAYAMKFIDDPAWAYSERPELLARL